MAHANTPLWAASPSGPLRVAVVGIHGYGVSHLRTLSPLVESGRCVLSAVVDQRPPEGVVAELVGDVPCFSSLDELLRTDAPEVVVIATPIPTHAALAVAAMRAGCHVLVEKPPTASFAEFSELLAVAEETGRACQIGFQTYGSHVFAEIDRAVAEGEIGEVTGIGGVGTWLRTTDYFARAPWAGRRRLDGRDVVDGVVTNPLAHAVATALRIDGSTAAEDVAALEVDLYRANDIEADDTSAVRVITRKGTRIALGLTLCAPVQTPPRITVHGTEGTITLHYKQDTVEVDGRLGHRTVECGYTLLLENLIAHVADPATPLLSHVRDSGAFMRVQEAVRTAPDPRPVPPELVEWRTDEAGTHPVVRDVEHWCERVARDLRTFTTLGAPWAPQPGELATLEVGGETVARYVDGAGTSPLDSPRPHLHPVRTRGGVVVTDVAPADHTWHAGVGVAVQDVAGHNLWGGRTYLPGQGYTWRSDHGRITHEGWTRREDGCLVERLAWRGHDDAVLLHETRVVTWQGVGDAWQLGLEFTLHNDTDRAVPLGSPGSNGRPAGGYGGFFWRLPACTDVDVRTADARGEEAVHGTTAPWLAWSARTEAGPFTVVLSPADARSAQDRWFVRAAGYPGVGSSLAWETPVTVEPGGSVTRSFRAVVADGLLTEDEVVALAEGLSV